VAHFQPNECGNRECQKHQKKEKKGRVHGEYGRRQHGAKGQQSEKKVVARAPRAEQAHDHGIEQQVNGCQQGRKKGRILRVRSEHPGNPPQIDGKIEKVGNHQDGCHAVRKFRAAPAPPPIAFRQQGRRRQHNGNQIELSGGYQREHAYQEQEIQRYFEIAAQRRRFAGRGRGSDCRRRGHWFRHGFDQFSTQARLGWPPRAKQ